MSNDHGRLTKDTPLSRTLFFYIFRDLVKVFLLASGVLAGIMSFGGLLKPLTRHGLDGSQVALMLTYAMPAMTTYSLPVAVLFACTFVYGRLAADNELTAIRAAGVSLAATALPGLVLGLVAAVISTAMLSYVVPAATFGAERVIYSNIAKLAANEVRRQGNIKLGSGSTRGAGELRLYAQDAQELATDDGRQAVALRRVSVVRYADAEPTDDNPRPVRQVQEVYLAGQATAFIDYSGDPDDDVFITVELDNGTLIPRSRLGREGQEAREVSFRTFDLPPYPLPSPLKEKTKFMDLATLHALDADPAESRRIGSMLRTYIRGDQRQAMLDLLFADIRRSGETAWTGGDGTIYRLAWRGDPSDARVRQQKFLAGPAADGEKHAVLMRSRLGPSGTEVTELAVNAQDADVRIDVTGEDRARVEVRMTEARVTARVEDGAAGGSQLDESGVFGGDRFQEASRRNYVVEFITDLPPEATALANRGEAFYRTDPLAGDRVRGKMGREVAKLRNSVRAEIHGRFSFAVSCAGLSLVGAGLGMMFKTGNVLTAFGLSVTPAIVGIVMVVAGQHVAENVPDDVGLGGGNPLGLGLILIWTGNTAATLLGLALIGWLWRR